MPVRETDTRKGLLAYVKGIGRSAYQMIGRIAGDMLRGMDPKGETRVESLRDARVHDIPFSLTVSGWLILAIIIPMRILVVTPSALAMTSMFGCIGIALAGIGMFMAAQRGKQ